MSAPKGDKAPSNSPKGGELFPSFGGVRGGCCPPLAGVRGWIHKN
jgi:hypothetical protein